MGNNVNDQVKKAFDTVRSGGVILYPTDTIWGLGCDATNRDAIEKLNSIKKRNSKSPMSVSKFLKIFIFPITRFLDR